MCSKHRFAVMDKEKKTLLKKKYLLLFLRFEHSMIDPLRIGIGVTECGNEKVRKYKPYY